MTTHDSSYVLITRPSYSADIFANMLHERGFKTLVSPLLDIQDIPFKVPHKKAYSAIMFTSAHGVKHFSEHIDNFKDTPVYTVGQRTRDVALKSGFKSVKSADGNAVDLCALIESSIPPNATLLHPRGQDKAHDYKRLFQERGYKYHDIVVYKAQLSEALTPQSVRAFENGCIGAVTLFSTRTAENFMRIMRAHHALGRYHTIKILCISESVLKCVHKVFEHVYVSKTPNAQGMVNLVERTCSTPIK